MNEDNPARGLAETLQAAARAGQDPDRADLAGSVALDQTECGALLRADHGAIASVVPTGARTSVTLFDQDGHTTWSGWVATATLLAHLNENGVTHSAVAAFVPGPRTGL